MVSFDTMALIWGAQRVARPGQEEMISWTAAYLADLKSRGTRVIITAPVLAEYLAHFDDDDRLAQLNAIQRNFYVAPFDVGSAALAAELWKTRNPQDLSGVSRAIIKADLQIIAASVTAGAERLISHDPHMVSLAQGKLLVKEIPNPDDDETFRLR